MDAKYFDEIKAREQAATPGPWEMDASEGDCGAPQNVCPRGLMYCDDKCPKCEYWEITQGAWVNGPDFIECGDFSFFNDSDADFIAHARTDIPALIAEVERLNSLIEKLGNMVNSYEKRKDDAISDAKKISVLQ
jgi:hypothetical protein